MRAWVECNNSGPHFVGEEGRRGASGHAQGQWSQQGLGLFAFSEGVGKYQSFPTLKREEANLHPYRRNEQTPILKSIIHPVVSQNKPEFRGCLRVIQAAI